MLLQIQIAETSYAFDPSAPVDISIPLRFNGDQPNVFDVPHAHSRACETESLIGDTRRGGSCNFEEYTLIPHCNGTHTECVGHITKERISVRDCLKDAFIPAMLITVEPVKGEGTQDNYFPLKEMSDQIITKAAIANALGDFDANWLRGLIIRTLPNDESKLSRNYWQSPPPYFSNDAMRFLVEKNISDLLVDLPSIDKTQDEGKLSNHRIFWNVDSGSSEIRNSERATNTITEMIYVPNSVEDGRCILNLQIAPFAADAAPSRPLLFRVD
jgi:kynurenine formamidase